MRCFDEFNANPPGIAGFRQPLFKLKNHLAVSRPFFHYAVCKYTQELPFRSYISPMHRLRSRMGSQMVAGVSEARSAGDHRNQAIKRKFDPLWVAQKNTSNNLVSQQLVRPLPGSMRYSIVSPVI